MAGATSLLKHRFPERYPRSAAPMIYRAPGRVNLIGEHTDYNDGFVLPITIEFACYAAVAPSTSLGNQVRVYSEDLLKGAELPAAGIADANPRGDWSDYVFGIAKQLVERGHAVPPLDILIHSTVPIGAGLSSSAALEISSALALSGNSIDDRLELARIGRAAENQFVGLPCGIMDQFISVFGREHAAIKIDCRSLEYEEVALPENVVILAVNTMVKHELGASAYRERVRECAEAVEYIRHAHPAIQSLRDATLDMLDAAMPEVPRNRARHVIGENERVVEFAAASRQGNLERMGELFVASHRSLQHDYEVSCEELDFLVDAAIALPGVYGARMTGGGFGGCTVNLVNPDDVVHFRDRISRTYRDKFQVAPQIYECRPSAGAGPI